jgi:hypothetical protein
MTATANDLILDPPLEAEADDPPEKELPITVPQQIRDNWCWAAVTAALEAAFDAATARSQCQIVTSALGVPCCPEVPANARQCNHPLRPRLALGPLFGRRVEAADGGTTFQFVVREIMARRFVLANLGFVNSRVGHLVVIAGFRRPSTLFVWDPYTGRRSEEELRKFQGAFRDKLMWRASYTLTRALP